MNQIFDLNTLLNPDTIQSSDFSQNNITEEVDEEHQQVFDELDALKANIFPDENPPVVTPPRKINIDGIKNIPSEDLAVNNYAAETSMDISRHFGALVDDEYNINEQQQIINIKKTQLLAAIEIMKETMELQNVDISKIPHVDESTSYQTVEKLYNSLCYRLEFDKNLQIGKECIETVATFVEDYFDGGKWVFGDKPDFRGWSNIVKSKILRYKPKIGNFTNSMLENNNLGVVASILLDFGPSLYLTHVSNKSKERNKIKMASANIQFNKK